MNTLTQKIKFKQPQFILFLPQKLVEVYKKVPEGVPSTFNLQLTRTAILTKQERDSLNLYDDNTRAKRTLGLPPNLFDIMDETDITNDADEQK